MGRATTTQKDTDMGNKKDEYFKMSTELDGEELKGDNVIPFDSFNCNNILDKGVPVFPMGHESTQLKVFTMSNYVKSALQELQNNEKIIYVNKKEKSDVIIYEDKPAVDTTEETDIMFGLILHTEKVCSLQATYFKQYNIAAYIDMIWNMYCGRSKHLIGDLEDVRYFSSGTLSDYVKESISKEEKEKDLELFTDKLKSSEHSGRGIIFAKIHSLVRCNQYAMRLEEHYPNVYFCLCACEPEYDGEQSIEAFLFR